MIQVEEESHEAIISQMEQAEADKRQFQELTKTIQEVSDRLLSVEIQLVMMVFEAQVHKEVEANFIAVEGTDLGSSLGKYLGSRRCFFA